MINYDYLIVRDEGNRRTEFTPKVIPKSLPVLSSIEAPNSSGKSTLLNLIGICFNGHKSKAINESLTGKMSSLLDTEYQELDFDIKIESSSETLRFIKKKGLSNIDRFREVDNRREYINVDRDYELIYDIPINPVERLKELTKEIGLEQESTEAKLRTFQSYVRDELDKAKKAKDPKAIKQLEKRISKLKEKSLEGEQEYLEQSDELIMKKKVYCVFHYNRLIGQKLDKNFHTKKKNQARKQELGKLKREYSNLSNLVSKHKSDLENEYSVVKKGLSQIAGVKKNSIKLWKFVSLESAFNTGIVSVSTKEALSAVKVDLEEVSTINDALIDQYYIMNELVEVLQKVVSNEMKISDDISATELLKPLMNQLETQKKNVELKETVDDLMTTLSEFENDIYFVNTQKYKRYLELKERSSEIYGDEIGINETDDIANQINMFKSIAIGLGINVDGHDVIKHYNHLAFTDEVYRELVHYSKDEFDELVLQLTNELEILQDDNGKNNDFIKGLEIRLDEIKNRDESKYKDSLEELELIINNIGDLISRFHVYKDFSEKLYSKKIVESEEFEEYSKSLGDYLAKKLGSILHIENEYKLKSVDIRRDSFEAIGGKVIRFKDMGTGQSQSTYLMSKLNSFSGKKIVALFDEIAMMDSNSLKPIYSKINKMYKDNELLTAIVVQKGDCLNVMSLEESND